MKWFIFVCVVTFHCVWLFCLAKKINQHKLINIVITNASHKRKPTRLRKKSIFWKFNLVYTWFYLFLCVRFRFLFSSSKKRESSDWDFKSKYFMFRLKHTHTSTIVFEYHFIFHLICALCCMLFCSYFCFFSKVPIAYYNSVPFLK